MNPQNLSDLYDAHYYATGCGLPYRRDEHWLIFFDAIAAQIVKEIAPQTVMDAGCAMGFLVESLRKLEVEAFGRDISEYAISQVHPDIAPYCEVGSVADPFPRHYDLIVCIEVLEHMPKAAAEQAIANFCHHADDIIFSSTPFDYKETTHFNVNPLEYWVEQFAKLGFYRDVDFDGSFLTSWTVRFRAKREPAHRIVRDYERKFWLLWKENTDLRQLAQETETQLKQFTAEKARLEQQVIDIEKFHQAHLVDVEKFHQTHVTNIERSMLVQLQAVTAQRDALARYRATLESSIGWPLLKNLQNLRATLSPPGSPRDQLLDQFVKTVKSNNLTAAATFILQQSQLTKATPKLVTPQTAEEIQRAAYHRWLAVNTPTAEAVMQQQQVVQQLTYKPIISFITPVYDPPLEILQAMIESVLAQTVDQWELCLVNGGSTRHGVRELLDRFARQDKRILVKHLPQNLGISNNSNQAIDLATGEFVAILDHDDTLAPTMLAEVLTLLNQHVEADIIYFDEDKLSEDGAIRQEPFFKSAPSPYLLLSTNYLMHAVFRKQLLLNVGCFQADFDGAQDWDLAFRCVEQTQQIYHIPKILYHWRKIKGSAALDADAKPWAVQTQLKTIETHLTRLGVTGAVVSHPRFGVTQVKWPISGAKVSIIIPTKDRLDLLMPCLASLFEQTIYPDFELVLVDNGSKDINVLHYYSLLRRDSRVKIIDYPGQFNYSAANNLGARHATGELLLFLNNDTQVLEPLWLMDMVGWAERPDVGMVGAKLIRPDGTIQHAGIIMGLGGHGSHIFDGSPEYQYGIFGTAEYYREYMAVTGACMLMRRAIFEQVGGFDETYFIAYSDIELGLAVVNAGYKVIYDPFARVLHHEGASRGLSHPPSDVLRASIRMLPFIEAADKFFNSNLSSLQRQPDFAMPAEISRVDHILKIMALFELIPTPTPVMLDNLHALIPYLTQPAPPRDSTLPLRIMVVSHDLSSTGAPIMLFTLAHHLLKNGYQVELYTPKDGLLRQSYEQVGITVHIHPDILDEPKVMGDVTVIAKFMMNYDLVLANTILTWQCIQAARALQKPSLWWIHESGFGLDLVTQRPAIASTLAVADSVIFASQTVADLYGFLSKRNNYHVIPYGIKLSETDEAVATPLPEDGKFSIVHVGSIEVRKGQDVLLKALANLPQPLREKINCYFVGRILEPAFYELIQTMIPVGCQVQFLGEMSHDRAVSYTKACHVFVLSSRDEVLPVTIIEAMGLGKAIIATNVGGVAELIQSQVNGLVVQSEDDKAIAVCLMRLFYDANYCQQLGQQARQTFQQRLTLDKFGQNVIEVIREILPVNNSGI